MQNKKAAMEMSVGTIVTIVLLMSVLVLGLVLIRSIFGVATDTVDNLGDKITTEMNALFTDEGSDIVVKLGSDKNAKIRVGTESFGVGIAAKSPVGDGTGLQYKLSLDDSAREDCARLLGEQKTELLVHQNIGQWINFQKVEGENAYAIILFTIPKGTQKCTQTLIFDVRDKNANPDTVGRDFFSIQVIGRLF